MSGDVFSNARGKLSATLDLLLLIQGMSRGASGSLQGSMGHMRALAEKRTSARTSFQKSHEARAATDITEPGAPELQFIPCH